jgi:O-antigen/teichoic acid export membrane protein
VLFDSVILALGFIYFYLKNNLSLLKWKFDKIIAKGLRKDSWPLIFASIASMINMRIDQVMLGNMTNFDIVGNYAAAIRISELWLMFPLLIGASIYPAIISARKVSFDFYRTRIITTIKYMAIFAIPFALLVTFLSDFIVSLLYAEQYKTAGSYLAIHIWSGLPYIIFFAYSRVIDIENIMIIHFYTAIFAIVTNLLLNNLFIPEYGGIGAAWTSFSVSWGRMLLGIFLLERKVQILTNNKK